MRCKLFQTLVLSLLMTGGLAWSQYPNSPFQPGLTPVTRPAVSPYLNLLRSGNSPAFNYNTLVRPQLYSQQQFQNLQSQVTTNQQSVTGLQQQVQQGPGGLPATGQPVGFMNHNKYFMNLGGSAGFGLSGSGGGQLAGGNALAGGGGLSGGKIGGLSGKRK